MKKYKNEKIKHIKAVHLWPSIVFWLITLVQATLIFEMLSLLIPSYLNSERIDAARRKANAIAVDFENTSGDERDVLDLMLRNRELTDSILIFDKSGRIVAKYNSTFRNKEAFLNDTVKVDADLTDSVRSVIYIEKNNGENLLDLKGEVRTERLYDENSPFKMLRLDMNSDDVIGNAEFWVENALSDGRDVFVKCSAPVYYSDLKKAGILGLGMLVSFMIPIVFLFISVFISVVNQKRITRVLYTSRATGGNNYTFYEHKADQIFQSKRNVDRKIMIVDLTIMKYQSYCNYHGIHAGEDLLEEIDKELRGYVGKNEFHALAAKQSFVLLFRYTDTETGKERVISTVKNLSEKYEKRCITFHAGIVFMDFDDDIPDMDPGNAYNRAAAARLTLPDENVPDVAVYNDQLLEMQIWEHKVEERMEAALANNEFHIYVQPKYDPVHEELIGAEALVRWINEEDGLIPPGKFIPIFEKNGFITKLDDYMISNVAKMQSEWLKQGKKAVTISVNVSRAHFANPELSKHICELVDKYDIPHDLLEIELTESAFFDDKPMLLNTVRELQRLGFEVSMDDFGAGYSSLNSLKDLPLDVLKLDADFFRGEDSMERGEIVVAQSIKLAKSLNMRIVAEGIEKKEQVEFLAKQGCDMIQGYYYAKPMPAEEYAERLSASK